VWVFLGICSAFFLGFHEIFKKVSVNYNAVLPVLFFSSLASAVFFLPFIGISLFVAEPAEPVLWYVQQVPLRAPLLFVIK